jgi:peptidoglycan hydrolase FlgJ
VSGGIGRIGPSAQGPTQDDAAHARLKKAAHDLEGVFVNELFKVMRGTVPQEGILSQGQGQDLFQGLFDSRIADLYAGRSHGGLGDALYRQLSRRLPDEGGRP